MSDADFVFEEPGVLVDGALEVALAARIPADPAKGWVPTYDFDLQVGGEPVGRISLRVGQGEYLTRYLGHLAYQVAPEFRGHRYAARGCALILPLALRHGLDPVWITCEPENGASRRTCELLGAELVEIVDVPEETPLFRRGDRRKCRYRLRPDPAIWVQSITVDSP